MTQITTLFLDLGGVVLTNGWDRHSREMAAKHFGLDFAEFEERHQQMYNLHEIDKITLDDYLHSVIFWKRRDFTLQQFREFMFAQSEPHEEMIQLIKEVKKKHQLRVSAVSNEGRDLAEYRIQMFDLKSFIDDFFISCFVHYQKPDPNIFKIALDVTQKAPEEVFYIDDRPNLVNAAGTLGIRGIVNTSLESTKKALESIL